MSNKYQIDLIFDREKIFKFTPPPTINFSSLPVLLNNWLTKLEGICSEVDIHLEEEPFNKHIGTASSYPLKDVLIKQLQLIYHRLIGHLDAELGVLSNDHHKAIIFQLTEELIHCTAGLHNRANSIVETFQQPRTLAELLYKLRKSMVDHVAVTLTSDVHNTSEIHEWNRVSVIAATDGLGIKANFPNDPFTGELSDENIRLALQKEFQQKFTPFNLPCLLRNELLSFMPELEIEKHTAEGLCLETTTKITKLIQAFLPHTVTSDPLDWQKYFKIYKAKNDTIRDLNWDAIYRYFFQALTKEGYFKQVPEIHNLIDAAYYNTFSLYGTNPIYDEANYIAQLFKEEKYLVLLQQLQELSISFPTYYKQIIANKNLLENIPVLIPYLKQLFLNNKDYSPEIIQALHLLTSLAIDHNHILEIAQLMTQKNLNGDTPLMFAAHYSPEVVKAILLFIDGTITNFSPDSLQQIFLEKQTNNNVLMLAVTKQAETVMTILTFLAKNVSSFASDTLEKLFTAKQQDSDSAFILAIRNQPRTAKAILAFVTKHITRFNSEVLRELLFTDKKVTALMLAASYQPDAVETILSFIDQHIENFDPAILRRLFLEKDTTGQTALMLAATKQAKAVKYILDFVDKHNELFDATSIQAMLLASDEWGATSLMLAATVQPEALIAMLQFISKNIQKIDPEVIRNILLKKIHDYDVNMSILFGGSFFAAHKTVLMAAERRHPEAAKAILVFIDEHIKLLGTDALAELLVEKDTMQPVSEEDITHALLKNRVKYCNPFINACSYYPQVMINTLDLIATPHEALNKLPLEFINFILQQLPKLKLERPEEQLIMDKTLYIHSHLLLVHFSKNYFVQESSNLPYVANKLLLSYLAELDNRKAKRIHYTTKFSFFAFRYSTAQKLAAANDLFRVIQQPVNLIEQLEQLKIQYPALTNCRLGNLFAAFCEIAKTAIDPAENCLVYFKETIAA